MNGEVAFVEQIGAVEAVIVQVSVTLGVVTVGGPKDSWHIPLDRLASAVSTTKW